MNKPLLPAALLSLLSCSAAIAQCTTPWLPGSTQTNGAIRAFATMPDGGIVAVGSFTQIEGVAANRIARWDGATWHPLGTGLDGPGFTVCALTNGDIVVGGDFVTAGGVPATRIARWNGATWSDMGTSWVGYASVQDVIQRADGTIVVGGSVAVFTPFFLPLVRVAEWNGSTFVDIPIPQTLAANGLALTLAEGTAGDLFVGCRANAAGFILHLDGVSVQNIGATTPLLSEVRDLAVGPSGDLIAAGYFDSIGSTPAKGVASWNGSSWSALGSGLTYGSPTSTGVGDAILVLPNGDLVVGGSNFSEAGGVPANSIARWNGTSWSAFGAGIPPGYTVYDLAFPPAGPLFVGGSFPTADGAPSASLARIGTTCPTTSNVFGYGCGTNTLAVTKPAWANGTFEAVGTGLPTVCWIITITSLSAVTPGLGMDVVYPMGVPGCDLFVAPDILGLALTTNGIATSGFFLPDSPPIVGVTFYHQWIPWEIQNGLITSITATNAVQLTAGAF